MWSFPWIVVFVERLSAKFDSWACAQFRVIDRESGLVILRITRNMNWFSIELESFHPDLYPINEVRREELLDGRRRLIHYFSPFDDMATPANINLRVDFLKWYLADAPAEGRFLLFQAQIREILSFSTYQRYLKIISNRQTLRELLDSIGGVTEVQMMDVSEKVAMEEKTKSSRRFVTCDEGFKIMRSLVWKAPWCDAACRECDYLEFDASFYCFKPYVYCIPHAIVCNVSVPLGISIFTSERVELYQNFYNLLTAETRESICPKSGKKKLALSDEGSALAAFCAGKFSHVLCHAHILRLFGTSPVSVAVNLLLTARDETEFRERLSLCNEIVGDLLKEKSGVSNAVRTKYENISGNKWDSDGQWRPFNSPYQKKALLFLRGVVTRCSNHSESIHRACAEKCQNRGKRYGFLRAMHAIVDYLRSLYDSVFDRARRQIREAARVLKSMEVARGECRCHWPGEMRRRWNVDARWPCAHVPIADRKTMVSEFADAVVAKLTAFRNRMTEVSEPPRFKTYPAFQGDGPAESDPGRTFVAEIEGDDPPISGDVSDEERVGIQLGRWILHTCPGRHRDEVISMATSFVKAKGYTEITSRALIETFRYVHGK